MFKQINKTVAWFTNMGSRIDENDGRDEIKVGVIAEELSDVELARRYRNFTETEKARQYLVMRKKEMLTCPDFMPTPSNATDIKATMRSYIDETMPAAKRLYAFLYQ